MIAKKEISPKKSVIKKAPAKKQIVNNAKTKAHEPTVKSSEKKPVEERRILTAEGWKRMMKRKGLL